MEYTNENIEQVLGLKYNSKAEYMLSTHRGVPNKLISGWRKVGEVPDSTTNDTGTMIILERPKLSPTAL